MQRCVSDSPFKRTHAKYSFAQKSLPTPHSPSNASHPPFIFLFLLFILWLLFVAEWRSFLWIHVHIDIFNLHFYILQPQEKEDEEKKRHYFSLGEKWKHSMNVKLMIFRWKQTRTTHTKQVDSWFRSLPANTKMCCSDKSKRRLGRTMARATAAATDINRRRCHFYSLCSLFTLSWIVSLW